MKTSQVQPIRRFLKSGIMALALMLLTMMGSPLVASAACPGQDTSRGQASTSFSIPTTGTYRVWSRMKASSSSNNSYILEIDGTTCGVVVGDSSSISASSWTWVNYKNGSSSSTVDVSLTAGNHTLVTIGREDNVAIDRIIFTTDTSCVPSGTGDNCLNSSDSSGGGGTTGGGSTGDTSGGTSSNTLGSGAGSTVSIKAADNSSVNVASGTNVEVAPAVDSSDFDNVTKVEYYIDGKLVDTASAAPFTYKVDTGKLASGAHKLVSKVYYKDGTTKSTTQTLNVKNTAKKANSPVAGIGISLVIVAAIIGGLILIQRQRGGFRWHGHTLIPAGEHMQDEVAAAIRSSNAPPDTSPLSNQTPAPGSVVEYTPKDGTTKPPQVL